MSIAEKHRLPTKTRVKVEAHPDYVMTGVLKAHAPSWKMVLVRLDKPHPVTGVWEGHWLYNQVTPIRA